MRYSSGMRSRSMAASISSSNLVRKSALCAWASGSAYLVEPADRGDRTGLRVWKCVASRRCAHGSAYLVHKAKSAPKLGAARKSSECIVSTHLWVRGRGGSQAQDVEGQEVPRQAVPDMPACTRASQHPGNRVDGQTTELSGLRVHAPADVIVHVSQILLI
jgi:hypothetical protein